MDIDFKKRTLIIWSSSFLPNIGGLESVVAEYANFLSLKNKVIIISNRYPRNLKKKDFHNNILVKRYKFFHSPLNYVKNFRFDLLFSWLFFKILTILKLFDLFIKNKPNAVNVHFPDNQIFEILFLKLFFKFEIIINLHGNEVERIKYLKNYSLRYYFYKRLFKESKHIIACSNSLISEAKSIFPKVDNNKWKVIYNGVNTIFLSEKLNITKSDYIFSAMRFVPKKGLDLMLKSLSLIKLENNIIIAGGDKDAAKKLLGSMITNLSVNFSGKLKPKSILAYLKNTRLTIIPSREEPYGIFLAEAICCGSPIVVTNVGGIPEVISLAKTNLSNEQKRIFDNFVKVVPPNIHSISKSIKLILENKRENDDYIKLIPIIRKNFEWEIILSNFYNLIRVNI